jgi:hypothetical protein
VLKGKVDLIRSLGFEIQQIVTHSIRKGSSSYLTSLPGGPPAAAIIIRGGWSMGNVKDCYFKYIEAGNQYCGCCLTISPVLLWQLAASPSFFETSTSEEEEYAFQTCKNQFGTLIDLSGFGKLLRMCVASMLHHCDWFSSTLYHGHVIFNSSIILRDWQFIDRMSGIVRVSSDIPLE